jgi:hypothetical protein
MIDKATVIRNIQEINRSAQRDWLDRFDVDALQLYLEHLHHGLEPRGGRSRWLRPGDTPPVIRYDSPTARRARFAS